MTAAAPAGRVRHQGRPLPMAHGLDASPQGLAGGSSGDTSSKGGTGPGTATRRCSTERPPRRRPACHAPSGSVGSRLEARPALRAGDEGPPGGCLAQAAPEKDVEARSGHPPAVRTHGGPGVRTRDTGLRACPAQLQRVGRRPQAGWRRAPSCGDRASPPDRVQCASHPRLVLNAHVAATTFTPLSSEERV